MANVVPLTIYCPPMPVDNTSWWNPWADRMAQEIACPTTTYLPSGDPLNFVTIFPLTRIKWKEPGRWMVDPCTAWSDKTKSPFMYVDFPEEPVIAQGRLMEAQPIVSERGQIAVPSLALSGTVSVRLPLSVGRPVGLGMYRYIVSDAAREGEAVVCVGTVTW